MNVTDKFLEVRILLTHDGFVPVLEQLAMSFMSNIETDHISCKKPSHECANRRWAGPKKKMGMVEHQGPCVTGCLCLSNEVRKPFNKVAAIPVIAKYLSPFYAPDHHMM
jgi:hypothetical protein